MKDYYAIMGLQRNANGAQIKEKYRFLAQQLHPDKPGGNEQAFRELKEAYDVLGDSAKRRVYDAQWKVREFVPPVTASGAVDLVEAFTVFARGRMPEPFVSQGASIVERLLGDRGINAHAATAEGVLQALGYLKAKRKTKRAG